MEKVICVLVLYNPNIDLLAKVVSAILPQVDLLWISDNSVESLNLSSILETSSKIVYKKMSGNIGIAAAQNYGINYAVEYNYNYLFYLDQDSIVPENIISKLLFQYRFYSQIPLLLVLLDHGLLIDVKIRNIRGV
mgnify:CR=1 FL=1